mmetsp:Transcript_24883/g.34842  ORF Transcript_24883/g.34842 Transcript_24883/m.34842 type:complete len:96 (+) Transcript_24883:20-307(+)
MKSLCTCFIFFHGEKYEMLACVQHECEGYAQVSYCGKTCVLENTVKVCNLKTHGKQHFKLSVNHLGMPFRKVHGFKSIHINQKRRGLALSGVPFS